MEMFELVAEPRADKGKGASRRLRRTGKVPAILYGGSKDPINLALDQNTLLRQLRDKAFYSHILTLKVDKKQEEVVLKDLQRHPSRPLILHADLMRISAREKLQLRVPIHFINEDICPGKKLGGIISHVMKEVEVSCLPKDLPELIEVDTAELEIGQSMNLSELQMPKGVEMVPPAHGGDQTIVTVRQPQAEEVEEEVEGEEGAIPEEAEEGAEGDDEEKE